MGLTAGLGTANILSKAIPAVRSLGVPLGYMRAGAAVSTVFEAEMATAASTYL